MSGYYRLDGDRYLLTGTRDHAWKPLPYCGEGSCDKPPGHDGIHRCRCGRPCDEPANGCAWHST